MKLFLALFLLGCTGPSLPLEYTQEQPEPDTAYALQARLWKALDSLARDTTTCKPPACYPDPRPPGAP